MNGPLSTYYVKMLGDVQAKGRVLEKHLWGCSCGAQGLASKLSQWGIGLCTYLGWEESPEHCRRRMQVQGPLWELALIQKK